MTEIDEKAAKFGYTNWRGEYSVRNVLPIRIWYGSTDWHPEPQWLLRGFDIDKSAERDFALKDIGTLTPKPQAGEAEPVALAGERAMLFSGLRVNASTDNSLRLQRLEAILEYKDDTITALQDKLARVEKERDEWREAKRRLQQDQYEMPWTVAEVADLRRATEAKDARIAVLEEAIAWALGENGDFPAREEGQGAYWWRTELRRRARALKEGGENG